MGFDDVNLDELEDYDPFSSDEDVQGLQIIFILIQVFLYLLYNVHYNKLSMSILSKSKCCKP
jgi:hypothetical protein